MCKILTFIAALSFSTPVWAAEVLVNIDKSTQEMTVFVDDIEQYRWPVSTGTRGYETPSGTFVASSMNEIWYSKQWDNAPMPWSVFFTKEGHAIHGTQEVSKLGTAASHGCVRLAPENAEVLYRLVEENGLESTQVVLVGDVYTEEYTPEEAPTAELPPEPEYEVPYEDEPRFRAGPDGFQFYAPGFQFQFKFDRRWKKERKWRKRRYND